MPSKRDRDLTICRLWNYLGVDAKHFPNWPPDLFAMCAAVLKKSGAYTRIVSPFDQDRKRWKNEKGEDEYASGLRKIGRRWRRALDSGGARPMPEELKLRWETVLQSIDEGVFRVAGETGLCNALLDLLAISDEACAGIGLPKRQFKRKPGDPPAAELFREEAEYILLPKQFGSTLCKEILPSVARVLPKMHTAQCGLTIRSFSHHLAYCESEEVRPSWISVPGSRGDASDTTRMNLLIIPWPKEVLPTQVYAVKERPATQPYNSFSIDIVGTQGDIAQHSLSLVRQAEKVVGKVDAVLFPELALNTRDYRLTRSILLQEGILVIAGVGARSRFTNYLTIDVPISKHHAVHFRQRKHHRWKLEQSQIYQYHLGSRLRREKQYWEDIDVQDRQLNFVVLRPWLVATALICEDLARHDPVGELIKGVGPNLVLALLMDGPQITQRWSSRYASGLADDPGCSVLSVTSIGMAELSRPRGGNGSSSRVIGLWKDAFSGAPIELDLPKDRDAVVMTLTMRKEVEKTADYRTDKGLASYPSLTGYHFVKLPDFVEKLPEPLPRTKWISPSDAAFLARLAQRDALSKEFMPEGLDDINGDAFKIGREIWRLKTDGKRPDPKKGYEHLNRNMWGGPEEEDTAQQILNWHNTNSQK